MRFNVFHNWGRCNAGYKLGSLADEKDEYVYLKSFLNIAGVNLTELDKIKE